MKKFLEVEPYTPPSWASVLPSIPKQRINLAVLPTPVHRWSPPGIPDGIELWIKRDDMSGNTLSGNKVRKLEFLMADAIDKKCDSVITIGALDSNCCRVTAIAARYLQLTPHIILCTKAGSGGDDPGLVGNVLMDRIMGAHVYLVDQTQRLAELKSVTGMDGEEYYEIGKIEATTRVESELQEKGMNPYYIPIGGSNALANWGYIECFNEILTQVDGVTDIVVACGSGSTIAGLALGNLLSGAKIRIHAYAVYDGTEFLYSVVDGLYKKMGVKHLLKGKTLRDLFRSVNAAGDGYAISQSEELQLILEISKSTGVILDPSYSGKAIFHFMKELQADPEQWKGRKILFIHTGGLLGLYDKSEQLQPMVEALETSHRFQLKQS